MKNFIKEKKTILIILGVLIILSLILPILLSNKNNTVIVNSYIKDLSLEDINITSLPCNLKEVLKDNHVPYFKLSNKTYDEINRELLETFLLRSCYQNGFIDYEASYHDSILSFYLMISYETDDDLTYLEYKSYNINTKTNTVITNKEILNKYHLNLTMVDSIIKSNFYNYYQFERNNNLLDLNISFQEYLEELKFKPITLENMNLFIDKKQDLYLLKEYDLSYGMSISEYYPNIVTKFKLN